MTTYDTLNPPEPSLIDDCVHCGFCLPTCPTYVLWGEEMDSPRGRIVLMRAGHEEDGPMTLAQVNAWDNCLGCMACVTACPSGVQYDKLIEDTRGQVERRWARPRGERLRRKAIFALFPHPERMKWIAPFAPLAHPTARLLGRFPRLKALAQLAPPRSKRVALPELTAAQGTKRGRVGFLQGCVQRVFFGNVNAVTVGVLAAEGFEVWAPAEPRCCGALQLHTGIDARDEARETIAAFEGCDTVVVNAAGCGSAMKDYGHLFRDDAEWSERAAAFSAKVRDVPSCWPSTSRRPRATRSTCRRLPRRLPPRPRPGRARAAARAAATIPGLELREPAEWELCCGSAGVWNLLNPEPAAELGQRKARNLLATGAQAVAAANPGCALHIGVHAGLPVHHRWSCSPPRSTEGSHDRRRPRPRPRRRSAHRRRARASWARCTRASSRAGASCSTRARSGGRGSPRARRSTSCPNAPHPRGGLAGRAGAARPAGPARGDHRPGRPQDGHQRAELGRARVHGRLRGLALADVGQRGGGPGQPQRRDRGHDRVHGRGRARVQLNDEVATLLVRPRGWHLVEKHVRVDGEPVAGGFVDAGLYLLRNATALLEKGSGPVFYLPKMESHLEARLWAEVFAFVEAELG